MLALIIIVCITAIQALGTATSEQFQTIADKIGDTGEAEGG